MKWQTIKNRCINEAIHRINNVHLTSVSLLTMACMLDVNCNYKPNEGTPQEQIRNEVTDIVTNVIEGWDIRSYQSLKEVFPKAFPKNSNTIELTDRGWILI